MVGGFSLGFNIPGESFPDDLDAPGSFLWAIQFNKVDRLPAAGFQLTILNGEKNLETQKAAAQVRGCVHCHLAVAVEEAGMVIGSIVRRQIMK